MTDKIQCTILATKLSNRIICKTLGQIKILGKISHKLLNGQNKLYAKSSNELSFEFIKFHLIQIVPRKVKTII